MSQATFPSLPNDAQVVTGSDSLETRLLGESLRLIHGAGSKFCAMLISFKNTVPSVWLETVGEKSEM